MNNKDVQPVYAYEEDMISLSDLAALFKKNQKVFWLSLFITVSLSFVLTILHKTTYRMTQVIQPAGYLQGGHWHAVQSNAELINYVRNIVFPTLLPSDGVKKETKRAIKKEQLSISDQYQPKDGRGGKPISTKYIFLTANKVKSADFLTANTLFNGIINQLKLEQTEYMASFVTNATRSLNELSSEVTENKKYLKYFATVLKKPQAMQVNDESMQNNALNMLWSLILKQKVISSSMHIPVIQMQTKIAQLKETIHNLKNTRILIKKDIEPVGLSKLNLLGLGLFISLIISLIITFLFGFTMQEKTNQ